MRLASVVVLLFLTRSAGAAPPGAPARSAGATAQTRGGPAAIDRIVAVVGDRAIALSELRMREGPFLDRIAMAGGAAEQAKAKADMERELLDRMIDETLEAEEATRLNVVVTSEDVDAALRAVAVQNRRSVADVLSQAKLQGLPEPRYREELSRQILEGKLLQRRLPWDRSALANLGDVERLKAIEVLRKEWLTQLRQQTYVEARL